MRYAIQYYDKAKENQISVMDFGLDIYSSLPILKQEFGEDYIFIYTDVDTKSELIEFGFDVSRIFTPNTPEHTSHTMRWLSIMAQFTLPFQICPIGTKIFKHDVNYIEVQTINIIEFNPILQKYGIEQTGGCVGGDIINIPNTDMMRDSYIEARDIVNDIINNNNEITEYEIQVIFGSLFYKYANIYKIQIKNI